MDQVIDGLYVGSAMAESDKASLKEAHITHILSDFTYMSVAIDDLPEENIIQYFPECNRFIGSALEGGGRVLVHCMAGQSRSATVAAAFVMQQDSLTAEQALQVLKDTRSQIYPNSGFVDQLHLYYDLNYDVSTDKALYRRFLISHNVEHFKEYGNVGSVVAGSDPSKQTLPAQRVVRCKKCRRPLVTDTNIIDHQAGAGQLAFSYNKRSSNGVDTPHAFPQNRACSSLFVEPMEWMAGIRDGLIENKVNCPKCDAKLGSYNWSGAQCSCGKWITPSFQIHRNRVDETRQR
ncbi:tyrosine protein phosphatase yvh1 [Coemansia sp. RSA 2320]|nr:tyrosine protein phosphatase yvh1 [Coemansia sp. RSA 2320]